MMLIPYIVLIIVAIYFAIEIFMWALAFVLVLLDGLDSYLLPLIIFSGCLIYLTPWYIWVPGIWFTLSYLRHKEDAAVKNPLIR
jgi:hypothetical protein